MHPACGACVMPRLAPTPMLQFAVVKARLTGVCYNNVDSAAVSQ
jgi:hypothetical protein